MALSSQELESPEPGAVPFVPIDAYTVELPSNPSHGLPQAAGDEVGGGTEGIGVEVSVTRRGLRLTVPEQLTHNR